MTEDELQAVRRELRADNTGLVDPDEASHVITLIRNEGVSVCVCVCVLS